MIHIAPPHTRADPDHINATSYTPAPSFPSMSSLLTEAILYSYIDIWAISSVYIFVCPPTFLAFTFTFFPLFSKPYSLVLSPEGGDMLLSLSP